MNEQPQVDDSILDELLEETPAPAPQPEQPQTNELPEVGSTNDSGARIVDDLGNFATRI